MAKRINRYEVILKALITLGGAATFEQIVDEIKHSSEWQLKPEEKDEEVLRQNVRSSLSGVEHNRSGNFIKLSGRKKWTITKSGENYYHEKFETNNSFNKLEAEILKRQETMSVKLDKIIADLEIIKNKLGV